MKKKILKIIPAVAPVLAVAAAFLYAYIVKPFSSEGVFCFVNRETGIKCPTCGLTRAVWCILNFKWKEAFYYHALFTAGFIPTALVLTGMGVNFYLEKRVFPLPKYRWRQFYIAVAVIVIFTVLRNFLSFIY